MNSSVIAHREPRTIPTYGLGAPSKSPVFFEKRVYQGSCGKVYPVPFIDKVYDTPEPKTYDSVRLENDFVRLVLLPEIGGRIFIGQDKANRDYDFFYRQDVIKPALVGLAGPWISGGVEFNWPQHHRPGTYLPADVHIEDEPDGAKTVWLSEHDPLNRLKGMHGLRLRPGSALIELRARLYNRTPFTQTFLWWANVAARVHDQYQSFFPPDVHYVADHAVRAQSSFPIANNFYYGVNYAARPGANDLSWYRNIPVPTSYMVCDTRFDFFGGYDHAAQGGFIHVANRHISPGKKQWTWGNHEFGWAWDRELTDANGPYVELMAGVYTDNQPDFSYLAPYETKTFSQFWWPFQQIGPVQNATTEAAIRLVVRDDRTLDLGAVSSRRLAGARIILRDGDKTLLDERVDLAPDRPWQNRQLKFTGDNPGSLELSIAGVVSYRPVDVSTLKRNRPVATEPPMPADVATADELFLIAEHLEQYRHPTRYPEIYWDEILRRDPLDARANIAYGRRKLNQGLLDDAAGHFEKAIQRLTHRHPNPYTGEAHYYLGLVRRFQGREEADTAFYKATWNYEWRAAAYYELAMLDCRRGDFARALEHCEASLDTNRQNNKARVLKALALQKLGREWMPVVRELLAVDPLDHWARHVAGETLSDPQTILDIAYDYADAGFRDEAIQLLEDCPAQMAQYALAWLTGKNLDHARSLSPDYFFPSRLHDQLVLEWALAQPGADRNAAFALGNYYYDKKRHADAIRCWEMNPSFATVWRNLGIAYWNVRRDGKAARAAYENALRYAPDDARLFAEYDQLRAKLGDAAADRLQTLLSRPDLVAERDDASVALATLYNETGQPEKALALLTSRRFHPWEGGEGKVLRQYTTAHLLLGQKAMGVVGRESLSFRVRAAGETSPQSRRAAYTTGVPALQSDAAEALEHFQLAMQPPANLGEAYHLLQAKADVNYWTGKALRALGREAEAVKCFEASANEAGDFQAMAVTEHSELSYYRGLSLKELGREAEARTLFEDLARFAKRKLTTPAKIDYFATSLPLLLVFEDDLDQVQKRDAEQLLKLAEAGLKAVA